MAASTAGGKVAAAVSRACDEELSQDSAEAQVPKWEEPGTVESQEITPNCLLQQGVLLILIFIDIDIDLINYLLILILMTKCPPYS